MERHFFQGLHEKLQFANRRAVGGGGGMPQKAHWWSVGGGVSGGGCGLRWPSLRVEVIFPGHSLLPRLKSIQHVSTSHVSTF